MLDTFEIFNVVSSLLQPNKVDNLQASAFKLG